MQRLGERGERGVRRGREGAQEGDPGQTRPWERAQEGWLLRRPMMIPRERDWCPREGQECVSRSETLAHSVHDVWLISCPPLFSHSLMAALWGPAPTFQIRTVKTPVAQLLRVRP